MALSVDNKGSNRAALSSTSVSVTFNVAANANLIIVGVSIRDDGASPNCSAVAVNGGSSFTSLGSKRDAGNSEQVSLWKLVNPPTGSVQIDATIDNTGSQYPAIGAVSFIGADTSTPTANFASAEGTSTTPSVNITSAVNDIVIDVVGSQVGPTVTLAQDASQTLQCRDASQGGYLDTGQRSLLGMSTEAGAASVTMSWTLGSSNAWAIAGVSVKAGAAVDTSSFFPFLDRR